MMLFDWNKDPFEQDPSVVHRPSRVHQPEPVWKTPEDLKREDEAREKRGQIGCLAVLVALIVLWVASRFF
jgi:hypothetical protein